MLRKTSLTIALILSNLLFFFNFNFFLGQDLEIHVLDVGQGDSVLIITPDRAKILVDTGPDRSFLSRLSNYIPYGNNDLDLVILSHFDADHVAGVFDLINSYKIERMIYTDMLHKSDSDNNLIDLIKTNQIKSLGFTGDDNYKIGCCVYLNILWPQDLDINDLESNDQSISFELIYKDKRFFFAGDLSSKYEDQVVREDSFLRADLLKVSHHGSKTSTSKYFLSKLKPEYAIISAGKDNQFGHPADEIIENLESQGIQIFTTLGNGDVSFYSDGRSIWR